MPKLAFRRVIQILAVKRIPFSWRRDGNLYFVSFNQEHMGEIIRSLGG
jgi:hypothetical protein